MLSAICVAQIATQAFFEWDRDDLVLWRAAKVSATHEAVPQHAGMGGRCNTGRQSLLDLPALVWPWANVVRSLYAIEEHPALYETS